VEVALMRAVVYELAVDKALPPEAALNQATVAPVGAVADKVTVPAPHLDALLAEGGTGMAFTVATTATLVAETHPVVVFRRSA
jgi:hypothetical protein